MSLQDTASDLANTQARLATGLLIASAIDDPSALATSTSLDNRASDLNRLLDSIGLAEQTLNAANAGIDAISDLAQQARSVALQALASGETTAVATGTQTVSGAATLDTLNFANGDTVEVTTNSGTTTFTVADAATQTVDDLVAALDANPGASVALQSGAIRIEATDGGNLTLAEGAQGTNLDDLGLTAGVTAPSVNATRASLAATFNELRTQISQLAADAGFNGVNLLNGQDLGVIFNADGSSGLTLEGANLDATGLGITAATNNFQDDASIQAALGQIEGALDTLRSQAGRLGSDISVIGTRESFIKDMVNTLEGAAADLTLADTNAEGAKLLALETRQQLGTASLSIAASADRNVLGLF